MYISLFIRRAVAALGALLLLFVPTPRTEAFPHGSADALEGRILVISVYADGPGSVWDLDQARDRDRVAATQRYLRVAAGYLEDVAADYGGQAEFVIAPIRVAALPDPAAEDDEAVWAWIERSLNVRALMRREGADGCAFIVFLNLDDEADELTCTRSWYPGMPVSYEIVYMPYMAGGVVSSPAVYAHELLHTFGAPDLYMEDEALNIGADFLGCVRTQLDNDIMYTCSDPVSGEYRYDEVTNEVGEVTAWYAGLIDESPLAKRFSLGESEHAAN